MHALGWVTVVVGVSACTDPLPEDPAHVGESITTTDCGPVACEAAEATDVEGCDEIVGESFECEGFCHVRDEFAPTWESTPPHSGDHSPVVLRALGEHSEAEPPARWLENLERGQIVLLHDCDEPCEAEREVLRAVMRARPDVVLMTEGLDLAPPRFAAVSWTWVWQGDAPDEAELLCFVDQHVGHGRVEMP